MKPDPAKLDGRRARTIRTHAAIVNAILDLVLGGEPAPTGARVAQRAGVALRSIRQHFRSREALFAAAAEVYAQRAVAAAPPDIDPTAPRDRRVARFASLRVRSLEASAALRRAVQLLEPPSQAIGEAQRRMTLYRRTLLRAAFAPELAACTRATARRELLDALDLVSGGRVWDAMRVEQGMSAAASEKQLRRLLSALLADAAGAERARVARAAR